MVEKIRVVFIGLGVLGSGVARLLLKKEGFEIVGACDVEKGIGQDLGEYLGVKETLGVNVTNNPDTIYSGTKADIAVINIGSFIKQMSPIITNALTRGMNVITAAEEVAYPFNEHPKVAEEIDAVAKEHGVTVLATGLNPGFMYDALLISLTAPCHDVIRVEASRVVDVAPYNMYILRHFAVGLTPEEFEESQERRKGISVGKGEGVCGHIGFPETLDLVSKVLGWKLDEKRQTLEPVIAKKRLEGTYVTVDPGKVCGVHQVAHGIVKGEPKIIFDFVAEILPEETADEIRIIGKPNINCSIKPGMISIIGTSALEVNNIPHVISARPGLLTPIDLPLPRALMVDVREEIKDLRGQIY